MSERTRPRQTTKRRLPEEALRTDAERLRQAIRVTNIGIFEHDHLTDEMYWSPELREIYGLTHDELTSYGRVEKGEKPIWNVVHPDDRERIAKAVMRSHEPTSDGLFDVENRFIRRDGTIGWVTIRSQTFFEGEGKSRRPVRTVGAVRDITSIKLAEQALSENENRLQQVINVSHIGVFDRDHVTGRVYLSSSMREFVGLSQDEAVSSGRYEQTVDNPPKYLETVHPDDRERVREKIERSHREGGIYEEEHRLLKPDGTYRWISVRALTTVEGDGDARRPLRTVGAMVDITERKRAEEEREQLQAQLVQAQKMESIGRLAGGVAHDFNNMLNVICGYAELVLDQLDPDDPLYNAVDGIRKAGRRSADLTGQLLAFARRQTVAPKVLNLNQIVTKSLDLVRRLIGEDVHLGWRSENDLWLVRADPSQLDQVLMNLCANARDAIDAIGEVTIRTANAVRGDRNGAAYPGVAPGEYVLLEVSDNGCGMDAETASHIFEPFYTTKAQGRGTGLGLATVYGIVKQNDGFISVSSEPGRGTTVSVLWPRYHASTAVAVSSSSSAEPQRGTETVLLVEDEPMVLGLSQHVLETLGYTVLPANTPDQALRIAKHHNDTIHLLLTDMVMPDMNGRDLAKCLVRDNPRLKCMFVSGYSFESGASRGLLEDGTHFLRKPFSVTDLAHKVREALEAP